MQRLCARSIVTVVMVAISFVASRADLLAQAPGGRGPGGRGQGPAGRGLGMGAPEQPNPPRDPSNAQPLATGTAIISGTVMVAGPGQPARRARVTLNATEGGGTRTAMTDESGHYVFSSLAAGRCSLSASKAGHVGMTYGATRPGRAGAPIQLADGEKFDAALQIARGSVVTGTVLDEHGEATPGISVRSCDTSCRLVAGRCSNRETDRPTIAAFTASMVCSLGSTSFPRLPRDS